MSTHPSRGDDVEARPTRVDAPVLLDAGGETHAPFDLPPEQAMALAQIAPDGIPDAQLAHRLGMTPAEAARVKGTLLRRRLVERTPPGRARATSRLVLTDRGQQGLRWLERLQTSLPPTLFDPAEPPPAGPFKVVDVLAEGDRPPAPESGFFARIRGRLAAGRRRESAADFGARPDEIFQWGFVNVALGTGFFGTAVLVGILQQSERAALTALGVGCLLAVFFFARAGSALFRHARAGAWLARRLRHLGASRSRNWPRPRPRSGRALD